jgi:hypothetical protein
MSRSENDIFEDFKSKHVDDGLRFREWWRRNWFDHVADYFERKWKLLPCGKFSKRPLAGFSWSERELTYEETIYYAGMGLNLAVRAETLSILDIDSEALRPFDTKTLTMTTPRGFQFFCTGEPSPRDQVIAKDLGFDTIRHGTMFSLIPLSRTCRNDQGGSCNCIIHDLRFREWVNFGAEALPLRKVLRDLA